MKINQLFYISIILTTYSFLHAAQAQTQEAQPINSLLQDIIEFEGNDSELKAVQNYIARGKPLLGITSEGETALVLAIKNKSPLIAKLLLEAIEKQYGTKKLQEYINYKNPHTADTFYEYTPLAVAASEGDLVTAKLLLAKGAQKSIEQTIAGGETPLILATMWGHVPLVELLLQNGANINAQDNHGHTPLMYAAGNNHVPLVALLLEKGADYTLQDNVKKTAYNHATEKSPARKLLANYEAKMKAAREHQPAVKVALERHVIAPLANITAEYAMPHAQEERELIEKKSKTLSESQQKT